MAYIQPLTGTITGNGQSIVVEDLSGISTVSLHLAGTWTADLNPEISLNGSTWDAARGSSSSGAATRIQFTGSVAHNAIWRFHVAGAKKFRIRSTAYTSGTVDVVISGMDAGEQQFPLDEIANFETGANPPILQVGAIPVYFDGATDYQRARTATGAAGGTTGVPAAGLLGWTGAAFSRLLCDALGNLRIDPTGTTTQPVSAASLPLPSGAATEATLATRLSESDFDSKSGSLTETAPATDTASSGLNGRLQRVAQRITSLIALVPAALVGGRFDVNIGASPATVPVSAASLPLPTGAATETTLGTRLTETDFDTKIGSLTETAPATDTASSGLNGRLQRIAQRLTSLIALIPAALVGGRFDVNLGAAPATVTVQGTAAVDSPATGNPVRSGACGQSADITPVGAADAVDNLLTLLGKQVSLPFALPGNTWQYAAAAGGLVNTTGVTAKAAAGAGIRNYVTKVSIVNSHQTTSTEVVIRDGAAGTVLWRGWAQAVGGGQVEVLDPPLRGTANTLIEIAEISVTATAGPLVNLQGYVAAE